MASKPRLSAEQRRRASVDRMFAAAHESRTKRENEEQEHAAALSAARDAVIDAARKQVADGLEIMERQGKTEEDMTPTSRDFLNAVRVLNELEGKK